MTRQQLISLINANGHRYLACEEDWEAEIIEWQTLVAIFEHGVATGFEAHEYNLSAIPDAVDDDSPGVPSMGCEAALIDLIERISAPEGERGIDAPELQDMLVLMETAFGRAEIRIETDDH